MKTILIQRIRKIAQKLYKKYRSARKGSSAYTPPTVHAPTPEPPPVEPSITVDISETPNPQACKYDVSVQVSEQSFSYSKTDLPIDHTLAQALLSVDGVTSVFGVHTFITVTKQESANWESIHPNITTVLQKILG